MAPVPLNNNLLAPIECGLAGRGLQSQKEIVLGLKKKARYGCGRWNGVSCGRACRLSSFDGVIRRSGRAICRCGLLTISTGAR